SARRLARGFLQCLPRRALARCPFARCPFARCRFARCRFARCPFTRRAIPRGAATRRLLPPLPAFQRGTCSVLLRFLLALAAADTPDLALHHDLDRELLLVLRALFASHAIDRMTEPLGLHVLLQQRLEVRVILVLEDLVDLRQEESLDEFVRGA